MPHPEETRDQILDAATRVFASKGYGGARMDDVVAESGLSKGTVYWHYKSKDGLLGAVLERLLRAEFRQMARVTAEAGSVAEGLVASVRKLAADLQRVRPVMPLSLEFYAMAARREWVRDFMRQYYGQYQDMLAASLRAGIAGGEFRPVAVEETAVTLTALIEGIILLWVIDADAVPLGPQVEAAFRLVLEGLRPR